MLGFAPVRSFSQHRYLLNKAYTEPMPESSKEAQKRSKSKPLRIWTLVDERAGTGAQSLGVAAALGLKFDAKEVSYGKSASLPNVVLGAALTGLMPESRARFQPPWPDLVIAAGRRCGPVARWIKRRSGGNCFLAHVMFPGRAGIEDFDLVAVPRHDGHAHRRNQLAITGAPHGLTPAVHAEAGAALAASLPDFAKPWIGLLVGGTTRRQKFSDAAVHALGQTAGGLARRVGGALLVATSRRTGHAVDAVDRGIRDSGATPGLFYRWGDAGDNPYRGILALAEALIVTGDSVSMCTEACSATAPVYIYAPPGSATAKHRRFHQELFARGYARPFTGELEFWQHPRLNAADDIASEIRVRLGI